MLKGYVITKENDSISESMADGCISSAKRFNLPVEKFYGVYNNIDETMHSKGIVVNPLGTKKVKTQGVKGCFLSHLLLWEKCVSDQTPMCVFEYDALIVNPLPENILEMFNHYLNLDYARHLHLNNSLEEYKSKIISSEEIHVHRLQEDNSGSKQGFKYINRNHIRGAYGYIIKPEGAQLLIDAARSEGMLPADVLPNLRYIDIHYTTPSVVTLNDRMLAGLSTLSHTKRG